MATWTESAWSEPANAAPVAVPVVPKIEPLDVQLKRQLGFEWPEWVNGAIEVCVDGAWLAAEPLDQSGREVQVVYEHDGDTKTDAFPPERVRDAETKELAAEGEAKRPCLEGQAEEALEGEAQREALASLHYWEADPALAEPAVEPAAPPARPARPCAAPRAARAWAAPARAWAAPAPRAALAPRAVPARAWAAAVPAPRPSALAARGPAPRPVRVAPRPVPRAPPQW